MLSREPESAAPKRCCEKRYEIRGGNAKRREHVLSASGVNRCAETVRSKSTNSPFVTLLELDSRESRATFSATDSLCWRCDKRTLAGLSSFASRSPTDRDSEIARGCQPDCRKVRGAKISTRQLTAARARGASSTAHSAYDEYPRLGPEPLGGLPPADDGPAAIALAEVRCCWRLGGLLKHYSRAAA